MPTDGGRSGPATSSPGALVRQAVRRDAAGAQRAHVPVAGADRLNMTEHIAIVDLMSLADAILLPTDDLSLSGRAEEPVVRNHR